MSETSDARVARLAVLGSAIAGRRLVVRQVPGERAYTDGTSIVVDPDCDFDDLRDAVVGQAALLAVGSLRKDLMLRLARQRSATTDRYLSLELHRAAAALCQLLPESTARRIESGCTPYVSDDADESMGRALSRAQIPDPPKWVGTLRPAKLRQVAEEDLRAAPTDEGLARLGELPDEQAQGDDEDDEDDAGQESKIVNLLSVPGLSNPLGDALQRLLGMGRRSPDKNQGGAEIPVATQRLGAVGRNAKRGRLGQLGQVIAGAFATTQIAGTRYPEWDCHSGQYKPDWCTVAEFDPADRDSDPGAVLSGTALRGPLSRVGVEAQRHRRQNDGDSLDMSALVDYAVDRRLGDDPDADVYENSRMTRRDLSVLVLLDCSGSTAEQSAGHTVFEEERELAGELTAALGRLGDRVGTFGFYSRGRNAVTFLRIKDFNARFDASAKRRLAAVQPTGFTRIGAAIRHAAHVLESRALAKNMILVVIGDGLPYDDGYEDRYARSDARQAIEEVIHRGIGVVGLGIRSSTEPEVLEEVWSIAPFRVVDDPADVQRHIRGLLRGALNATRSNGRRRDLHSADHQHWLRSATSSAASKRNSYV